MRQLPHVACHWDILRLQSVALPHSCSHFTSRRSKEDTAEEGDGGQHTTPLQQLKQGTMQVQMQSFKSAQPVSCVETAARAGAGDGWVEEDGHGEEHQAGGGVGFFDLTSLRWRPASDCSALSHCQQQQQQPGGARAGGAAAAGAVRGQGGGAGVGGAAAAGVVKGQGQGAATAAGAMGAKNDIQQQPDGVALFDVEEGSVHAHW